MAGAKINPIKKIKNQRFRFLKNALASYEEEDKEIIDDEHWVFEMDVLPKKKLSFVVKSSYMDCVGFGLQRFSSKGFNLEIEKLNERLINEHSENLCDELGEYINEHTSKKRAKSEESSESDEDEILEEVPKKRKFMKPE